jgi:hypothetical protein
VSRSNAWAEATGCQRIAPLLAVLGIAKALLQRCNHLISHVRKCRDFLLALANILTDGNRVTTTGQREPVHGYLIPRLLQG